MNKNAFVNIRRRWCRMGVSVGAQFARFYGRIAAGVWSCENAQLALTSCPVLVGALSHLGAQVNALGSATKIESSGWPMIVQPTGDPRAKLRLAIAHHTFIPVVGAGASAAVAGMALWRDLAASGIEYADKHSKELSVEQGYLDTIRDLLESDAIAALDSVQRLLKGQERKHWLSHFYAAWLEGEFASPSRRLSHELLESLSELEPRVVVTTNYDLLLDESVKPGSKSATWLEPTMMREILRADSGVIHLHGRYDVPESVILSSSDYQRLIGDKAATRTAHTLFDAGVLVFIGASPDGVDDPHLGGLLRRFADFDDLTGENGVGVQPHFFLHPSQLSPEDRVRLRSLGVQAVSYGRTFDDLPVFLRGLVPETHYTARLDHIEKAIRSVLLAADMGTGVRAAAELIKSWVYPDLDVRVGFAECDPLEPGVSCMLRENYVFPGDSPSRFHYPISIAGWALAEGRTIAWPVERSRVCDTDRLRKLKRLADVTDRIDREAADVASELRQYIKLDALPDLLKSGLTLEDMYQDWSNTADQTTFEQFLSVPVPRVVRWSNAAEPPPCIGAFNIDAREAVPALKNPKTSMRLGIITDLVYALWQRVNAKAGRI